MRKISLKEIVAVAFYAAINPMGIAILVAANTIWHCIDEAIVTTAVSLACMAEYFLVEKLYNFLKVQLKTYELLIQRQMRINASVSNSS